MAELTETHRRVENEYVPGQREQGVKRKEQGIDQATGQHQPSHADQPGDDTMLFFTRVEQAVQHVGKTGDRPEDDLAILQGPRLLDQQGENERNETQGARAT